MALSVTYDAALSRIRLAGTALGASATYALFDRTVNGVTYTTVRAGAQVPVVSLNANLDDFEFPVDQLITYRVRSYNASNVLQQTFTTTITQTLTQPWLKIPAKPFLNMAVTPSEAGDISTTSRSGIFPVIGRNLPVAVTDAATSRSFDLKIRTETAADAENIRTLVAPGDIVFLHTPTDYLAPGGYYAISGDVVQTGHDLPWKLRWFSLPLTEVAAPGPDIAGVTYSWQGVLNDYATWSAVIAANATWLALLDHVNDDGDVVVP